jgi:hypothetical protein
VRAHDTDVVVQPQPFVSDGERESSADDLEVELEGDAHIKASASAADPELGKEGYFPISTDVEGLLFEVEDDDDLPKSTVSSAAQKSWQVSSVTLTVTGPILITTSWSSWCPSSRHYRARWRRRGFRLHPTIR